jgi:hypothetical protein
MASVKFGRRNYFLEIETAKTRHASVKAEMKRGEPSPALVKYLRDSLQELRVLKSLVAGNIKQRSDSRPRHRLTRNGRTWIARMTPKP